MCGHDVYVWLGSGLQFYLEKASVKVFQMNSRNENMILRLTRDEDAADVDDASRALVGRTVYAGWPHMCEVRIVAVSDGVHRYSLCEAPASSSTRAARQSAKLDIEQHELDQTEARAWVKDADGIQDK